MTQCFNQSPEPAVPGQKVTICWTCTLPASGTVTFGGLSTIVHLGFTVGNGGCDTFQLPLQAYDFIVVDDAGVSDAFAGLVE